MDIRELGSVRVSLVKCSTNKLIKLGSDCITWAYKVQLRDRHGVLNMNNSTNGVGTLYSLHLATFPKRLTHEEFLMYSKNITPPV
jgi:hypothetical protein